MYIFRSIKGIYIHVDIDICIIMYMRHGGLESLAKLKY